MSELDLTKFGATSKDDLRKQDLDLWKQWKENGEKPEDLKPLLGNLRGVIRSQANRWAGNVELPPIAVHAEFTKQAINALRKYDPGRGANLGTWVTSNLVKAQRWVTSHQNTARITEKRVYKVGEYQRAFNSLDDMLGREPTTPELADHLKWSEKEVMRVGSDQGQKDLIESAFEGDPTSILPSRTAEVMRLVKYELTPEEHLVYEYTIGTGGKPQLSPGQIARTLSMSPSKVTNIRNKIYQKAQRYM